MSQILNRLFPPPCLPHSRREALRQMLAKEFDCDNPETTLRAVEEEQARRRLVKDALFYGGCAVALLVVWFVVPR